MKECKQIENNLPLYLDDSLSGADKKAVEEHLKSCPGCAKNLAQLRKTQSLVNTLAEVEPPAWFKQKIMAGVREEAEKKSLLQKIFYPLKIKIPVQIFATVCIAVLAVYIYRAGEDQMQEVVTSSVPAPVVEVQKSPLPERKLKSAMDEVTQKEEANKQEGQLMPAKGVVREKDFAAAPPPAARDLKERAASAPAAKSVLTTEKADKLESKPMAKSNVTAEEAGHYERADAAKSAVMQEAQLEKKKEIGVGGVAMKADRALQVPSVMKPSAIYLKVSDVDKAVTEVEKLFIKYEARNISRQITSEKTILTLELKNKQIKDFRMQLKIIGRVEEGSAPATDGEGNVNLVIEISNN